MLCHSTCMMGNIDTKHKQSASHEHYKILSAKAIARIETLDLNPIPEIYEVWYRYYLGEPLVIKALDQLGEKVTEDDCLKIYSELLSDQKRQDNLNKIGEQIQLSTSELSKLITAARSAAGEFGSSLDSMTVQLDGIKTADDLIKVVAGLTVETTKMVEKNKTLETQLAQSEKQINILKSNLDHVQKEAMIDGLTGLVNRKTFDKNIKLLTEDAVENGTPIVLMMLDIDHFKKFNDTYGHLVGDRILRLVARTLIDNVKGRDTAARYGGEEFAIILPETPLSSGLKVAENLRRSVEGKELINKTTQEHMGKITMSIGIGEFAAGESISALIERVDNALYDAKKNGRNRVAVAKPPQK